MGESEVTATETVDLPVDLGWLESLIQKEYETAATIKTYNCSVIGDKKGFLSVITKIDIDWGDASNAPPTSYAVKKPTFDKIEAMLEKTPEWKDFMDKAMITRVHNVEVKAYKYFNLYKPAPFPMAKCLFAEEATDDTSGILILEFVQGKSMTFNDDYSLEQLEELTRNIAALQAYSINHGNLSVYFGEIDQTFLQPLDHVMKDALKKLQEEFPSLFPNLDEKDIAKTLADNRRFAEKVKTSEQLGYTPVAALGDSQPNNILWQCDSDGSPGFKVAAFIDFQICHLGSCLYDLCQICLWGIKAQDRCRKMNHLLELYHSALNEATGGKAPLTLKELKREFDEFYPLFVTMFVPFFSEMVTLRDMFGITKERVADYVEKAKIIFNPEDKICHD